MKKKVLFLITKSNWGGAQRYVYDLATHLDSERYEPIVALGGAGELRTKLEQAHIQTVVLPTMKNTLSVTKLQAIIRETKRVLSEVNPDILHCNSSIAGFAGVVAGRKNKIEKIIFTAHGWAFNEDRSFLQKIIFKFFHWLTVLLSHHTIAVSNETTRQLRWPLLQRKWVVIHNGRTQVEYLSRDRARELLGVGSGLVTGTIGELHPIKGHDVMIRAVANLKKQGQTLQHVIIGAGQAEPELRKLATELGVEREIIFSGAIHEAAQYLLAFDIYVQPSHSEALGFTVIEAAQAGLPTIASRVGGIPEIITHEHNGLLVPSNDVISLSSAINELIADPTQRKRLAVAAKQTSVQFSFEQMLQKTAAVYESNTTSSATAASRAID